MAEEMEESQFKQGENSSFCKCLLFTCLVFRHWARYCKEKQKDIQLYPHP